MQFTNKGEMCVHVFFVVFKNMHSMLYILGHVMTAGVLKHTLHKLIVFINIEGV